MRNFAILRLFVILYIEKDKKRDGMSGLKEWKEKFPTPRALAFSPVPSLPSLDGSIARIIFSPVRLNLRHRLWKIFVSYSIHVTCNM